MESLDRDDTRDLFDPPPPPPLPPPPTAAPSAFECARDDDSTESLLRVVASVETADDLPLAGLFGTEDLPPDVVEDGTGRSDDRDDVDTSPPPRRGRGGAADGGEARMIGFVDERGSGIHPKN